MSLDKSNTDLSKVIESFMQIGHHARWRLVGDLDGCLQDTLGDDVSVTCGRRLRADEHAVRGVTLNAVLLYLLLECAQPLRHEVNVLHTLLLSVTDEKSSHQLVTVYVNIRVKAD